MKTSFSKSNQSGRPRRVGFAVILAAFIGLCVATNLRAQVIVVPNANATNDGNSAIDTGAPGPGPNATRYMLILDASQFGALAGPSFLTQLALRPDRVPGRSGPHTNAMRIYASTTRRTVTGMSTSFANNLGTNNTLVLDGSVTYITQNLPGPGNTRQFDLVTPLTTPFLYDPAAGNLLLDFQSSSGSGSGFGWDSVTANLASRGLLGPGSATASTGFFIDSSVYQFTFEAPPVVTIQASQVEVCWNSQSNLTYQVQYRSDLTTNRWTSLVDCVQATGATSHVSDPIVAGQPQKFYRVVLTACVPD